MTTKAGATRVHESRANTKGTSTMHTTTKHTASTNHHVTEEATMHKGTKKTVATSPATPTDAAPEVAATTTPGSTITVPAQLQLIEQRCGYPDPLTDKVRVASETLVRRVPGSIIERVIALAIRGGGKVAGIAFDPDAAKAALAEADEADAVATAAEMLARRAQDHATSLRAGIAGDASGIRTALRGFVKTKQGASLASESEELSALGKQHLAIRKARRTRLAGETAAAPTTATPPASPTTPATEPAVVAQPTAPKAS